MNAKETPRPVAIIGAGLDLGAGRRGVDMGPSAIRYAELESRIRRLGREVVDRGDVRAPVPEAIDEGDPTHRYLDPIKEVCGRLAREDHDLMPDDVQIYFRDCYDHAVQAMEVSENFREVASGLLDIYLSSLSNRLNDVMRVLTIISTIFIPLTFIAGIYGMNFDPDVSPWNMPELRWYWGYPFSLLLMAVTAAGMLLFFYQQGWTFRDRK